MICRFCGSFMLGRVGCHCQQNRSRLTDMLAAAGFAEVPTKRRWAVDPVDPPYIARRGPDGRPERVHIGSFTTATVKSEPVSLAEVRKIADEMRAKIRPDLLAAIEREKERVFSDIFWPRRPMSIEPDPADERRHDRDSMKYMFAAFPLFVATPPRSLFLGLDMGADYPRLRATISLSSTPELRRAVGLHQARPNDRRRTKRVLRLLRREIARQG